MHERPMTGRLPVRADRTGTSRTSRPRPRPGAAPNAAGLDGGAHDIRAEASAHGKRRLWDDAYAIKRLAAVRAVEQ